MKNIKLLFVALVALFGASSCSSRPIDVLVISGQTANGHNWEMMVSSLEKIYGGCESFNTEFLLMCEQGEEFNPTFSDYDVVVMTISMAEWSDEIKSRFEEYVSSGGGVVAVHEGASPFPEWREYNRMMGINGWAGRNESNGPYYYWSDGEFIKDYSPGIAGKHGKRVPFDINVRSENHPIMEGLPTVWTHYDDELYGLLRGEGENMEVLATAFSQAETGGSGREEPVMMVIDYGKGRIFHTVLGHTQKEFSKAMDDNLGFQVTLLRGTEWAATGKVKSTSTLTF